MAVAERPLVAPPPHLRLGRPSGMGLDHADWVNSFCCVSFRLLVLFQMGQFYYAAKAFDALEKLDPDSDYWEGKRGACVGVFQLILANKESKYASVLHLIQLPCIFPFFRGIVLDVCCRDVRGQSQNQHHSFS